VLSKVTTNNNSFGIFVNGSATTGASLNVTFVDSEASSNSNIGVLALSNPGTAATAVMLRNSVASNNCTGLEAARPAILRVAHSVVTGNSAGVNAPGANLFGYDDNDIDGNTNNNIGVLTPLPPTRRMASPALRPARRVNPGGDGRAPEPGRTRLSKGAADFGAAHLLGFVKF
jgi:hypothetical protein